MNFKRNLQHFYLNKIVINTVPLNSVVFGTLVKFEPKNYNRSPFIYFHKSNPVILKRK